MRTSLPFMARLLLAALFAAAISQSSDAAPASGPVIVELFQSQGCSSCPPANDNVLALIGRPGVLALSFQVTYWDYLGWKDTFATRQTTQRQYDYAAGLHLGSVATPDVVVDGRLDITGLNSGELDQTIRKAGPTKGGIVLTARSVALPAGAPPARPADVWLVRYDPREVQIAVQRGENSGQTLPHRNVVRQLIRLGSWSGAARTFPLPATGNPAYRTAVLVQAPAGGPILAAAG